MNHPRQTNMSRRTLLKTMGVTAAVALTSPAGSVNAADVPAPTPAPATPKLKGNLKHSVSRWCYGKLSVEQLAQACQRIGIQSIELVGPKDFAMLQKHKLVCAMTSTSGHSIAKGFNRPENHPACIAGVKAAIDATAAAGFPNVICFSGNRAGMSDADGLTNCVAGLKQVVGYAEEKNVTICLELLNSKHNHKDYMCDHTAWGVELCQRVGSPRLKLLYDIYHMQIMEGDIIETVRTHIQYIGHVHTGGVPGRNEIDDTQELNYPAIMRALVTAGYQGYVGQEFVPKRDSLTSLEQAIRLCDV